MRTLYCRHADCRAPCPILAGKIPVICPTCNRPGKWSADPDSTPYPDDEPDRPYVLTENDRRLLHSMRIDPER